MHYIGTTYYIKPTDSEDNIHRIELLATVMPNHFRIASTDALTPATLSDNGDIAAFALTRPYERIRDGYALPHPAELPSGTPLTHLEPHIGAVVEKDTFVTTIHIPVACAWASEAKALADDLDQLVLALFGDDLFCMKRKTAEPGAVFDDIPTVTTRL